jgi:hypothetical protein
MSISKRINNRSRNISKKSIFYEYESFEEKFKRKKTTDECYTPPYVYDLVLDYAMRNCKLYGKNIVRPFYPELDYESYPYTENDVVVDNPPFSILSIIVQSFAYMNVPYFLFAPHLTLFNYDEPTKIICGAKVMYDNGAVVATSFISNMFGGTKIILAGTLNSELNMINKPKNNNPSYIYPRNIVTVSILQKTVNEGVDMKIENGVRLSELQTMSGKSVKVFGGGYILSDDDYSALEKSALEKSALEKKKTTLVLNESNKETIKYLNKLK